MLIWLLALILIASVAALGLRQGGIRVAFSFLGIIVGALLAPLLGKPVGKLISMVGIKDPLLLWVLGPVIVFIIISAAFKIGGFTVHQKIDVYYKYKAGDLRLALWERLNQRLGVCVGVLNGVAYAVILSFVLYLPGYAAVQFRSSEPDKQDPKWLRLCATLGEELHSSGMDKVARSIGKIPETTYRIVDLGAVLYRNPLSEARLATYPGFLSLAELPEFAELSTDGKFLRPWQEQVPIMELLDTPRMQGIRNNPEVLKAVWAATETDLADFNGYLRTGRSPKYDPTRILGRWAFDVNAAVGAIRRTKPTMSSRDMQSWRRFIEMAFGKAGIIARPDHSLSFKNTPGLTLPTAIAATPSLQNLNGQWKDTDGNKYVLGFSGTDLPARVDGDRLSIKSQGVDLMFNRED